MSLAW